MGIKKTTVLIRRISSKSAPFYIKTPKLGGSSLFIGLESSFILTFNPLTLIPLKSLLCKAETKAINCVSYRVIVLFRVFKNIFKKF